MRFGTDDRPTVADAPVPVVDVLPLATFVVFNEVYSSEAGPLFAALVPTTELYYAYCAACGSFDLTGMIWLDFCFRLIAPLDLGAAWFLCDCLLRVELDEKLSLRFEPTDTLIELFTFEFKVAVMILDDDF